MDFKNIPEMIRERADKYQEKVVLKYRDKKSNEVYSKNWIELVSAFSKLSKVLLSESFGAGDNIGIFAVNSPEWTITDLAILDIRAAVVPFFSTASKEQCKYIVDETKMKLMFVGDQEQLDKACWLLDNTTTLQTVVVFNSSLSLTDKRCRLLQDYRQIEVKPDINFEAVQKAAKREDLATIIYTSGTTGEPKGVMLTNENFLYTFGLHQRRLDLNDQDVSMCFLPLSHIFERTWTFYLFFCGGVNFYLDNPREVIDMLPVAKPTVMCTVPRFFEKTYEGIQAETDNWSGLKQKIFNWSILVGGLVSDKKKNSASIPVLLGLKYALADKLVLKKLRRIFGGKIRMIPCSGAALPLHLLKFFHATGIFVNYGYGATETTATVSCFKTDVYEFESCGTIMPGLELKISDKHEIMVKGKTIFAGYYNKPEATEEVLVDGWYKTGDEGSISPSGNLVMTDRLKDLMKTSVGKYISPQKLETILGQDVMIEQVVVIGDNRKYVTALIVPVLERIQLMADKLGMKGKEIKELLKDQQIRELISKRFDALQSELSDYEKIKDFVLLSEPFSIESDTLTSTLKIRRKVIVKKYASVIDKMYEVRSA